MKQIIQHSLALTGLRILVVDDDEDTRFYITTVLTADGATVTTVDSAAAALAVLPELQPDVCICDIAMPGEDGYSLIRKIRALPQEQGGEVLAVAVTAYADTEDRIRALEAGFNIHLGKPVVPEDLVMTIANLVNFGNDNYNYSFPSIGVSPYL
jgi:CheY-like chemotaxis protein